MADEIGEKLGHCDQIKKIYFEKPHSQFDIFELLNKLDQDPKKKHVEKKFERTYLDQDLD